MIYAKPPFAGPEQVFAYLGRYTHRVGLSNHRLRSMDERGVCFRTRGDKTVTLSAEEFVRRFLLEDPTLYWASVGAALCLGTSALDVVAAGCTPAGEPRRAPPLLPSRAGSP
ncbi:transposase [Sorangium sp. So ce136]|uniref:transposase n=1 Tax=Sorangium sp. So ce136 TaxID=3133284 RepID=UPI003F523F05